MSLKKLFHQKHGLSFPITVGLITVLFAIAATMNRIVTQSLQSITRIQQSNAAYFLAEGGLEDALYELSSRKMGYQTGALGGAGYRQLNPYNLTNPNVTGWYGQWDIQSRSGQNSWTAELKPNQKVVIPLYYDKSGDGVTTAVNGINTNAFTSAAIERLNLSGDLDITLTLANSGSLGGIPLQIDNDRDGSINEDGVNTCAPQNSDCDGDGQINEDSTQDPLILWQLNDGNGRKLIPIQGCIRSNPAAFSQLCESDFNPTSLTPYSVSITQSTVGTVVSSLSDPLNGTTLSIGNFINGTSINDPLQLELLWTAPPEHETGSGAVHLEKIDYTVSSSISNLIPYPTFTIHSDGFVNDRKQSLTTTIYPQSTGNLFDFTVIQQ
ncbi:hypothetical protein IPJ72_01665 [Candidatus Peregrinibacteria bacterium]|nr:MAG: hypothetical protein IPJ72_01665 [Candidatus Peregrinibacteria bacterium]